MAGTNIPLFRRQSFNFSGGNAIAILVRSLDVSQWTQGVLNVRVHSENVSAGTYTVAAYPISNTPEEPDVDYRDPTAAASVAITSATGSGLLVRDSVTSGFGGALQIRIEGTSSSSGEIIISADLSMKD